MSHAAEASPVKAITITPINGKTFGALVTGVDVTNLSGEEWKLIESAFHEHALLIFPGQFLSDEAQVAFAKRFGDKFEYEEAQFGNRLIRRDAVQSIDLETLRHKVVENGSRIDNFGKMQLGTQFWHSDSTYTEVSAKAGILSARTVPPSGGGTGFADMRAAYDALDNGMKDRLQRLNAYHSNLYSEANDVCNFPSPSEDNYTFHRRAYLRPLVKVHPVSHRRSLQIGRHAFGIPGFSPEASVRLLKELVDFACQGARVYEHAYSVGDLLIWDNRCLLHRSLPYDYSQPRNLRGTRISGDPKTEGAIETPDVGAQVLEEEMRRLRARHGLSPTPLRSSL